MGRLFGFLLVLSLLIAIVSMKIFHLLGVWGGTFWFKGWNQAGLDGRQVILLSSVLRASGVTGILVIHTKFCKAQ